MVTGTETDDPSEAFVRLGTFYRTLRTKAKPVRVVWHHKRLQKEHDGHILLYWSSTFQCMFSATQQQC